MYEHAAAILAAPAVYCIHVRINTKQGAVKLSQMLMKSMHHLHRLPSKHVSAVELLKLPIRYNNPVDYKGENGQQ